MITRWIVQESWTTCEWIVSLTLCVLGSSRGGVVWLRAWDVFGGVGGWEWVGDLVVGILCDTKPPPSA